MSKLTNLQRGIKFFLSQWHRKDVFEKLVKLFLIVVSYINLDRENFLKKGWLTGRGCFNL
ncbi:MAG: hypothetical protein PWP57_713 [Candidatus Atribacteria bacterium]|nr:hypothetical protein [Candidatus Atribacteria bacterium]